jgi:two-component system, cell cycle sensor histidine kinase and response regulator CckA
MTLSMFWIFDSSSFTARWDCGNWPPWLGWLHIVSDLLIWLAYLAIPLILVHFVRRRRDLPFPRLFWLFGAFILTCGTTHLLEAVIFYQPVYRLAGVLKLVTALASWATVLALIPIVPRALAMRTPGQMEREVSARTAELARANAALLREVGERLRAEQALREQRERLRLTLASIGDGVLATDRLGHVTFINEVASTLTGWAFEDALGKPLKEVFPLVEETTRQPIEIPAALSLREGTAVALSNSAVLRARDGAERPIDNCGAPIRGNGTIGGAVLIFRDVTERRRADEALRLRDRAIQAVMQGILITDPNQSDNPIVYASPGFERLTGYTAAEVLSRNCRFLQGKDTDRAALARIRGAVEAGEPCTVELLNYRKDGTTFWNELSVSPVRDESGRVTHFVGVQADVTQRRLLQEQYRQVQKMEAFGQLAGGVAHDFNNLLTIINGYSEFLLQDLPTDDPSWELITEIHKAGERSAGLTRQMLAFSRKQVLAPRVLDLNAVVDNTASMLRRLLGEDVRLSLAPGLSLWSVRADPGQVEQILMNLAVNARDAMPTGGRLTVATANVELDEGYAQAHPDARPGPHTLLSVSDTGSGMSPEVRARIFEPFFTTKAPGKGTGLGLATVYGIVKQSGGHVELHSAVGVGTTFKVYLPAAAGPETWAVQAKSAVRSTPRGTETVLVVEDEGAIRALMRHILAGYGYSVLEAARGDEAVRVVESHAGPIHLLISDVVMPGIDGRVVAERVAARHPAVRVLFISGYMDDAVVRHGILQEEVNFLQKPFSPVALAHKVREVLDVLP